MSQIGRKHIEVPDSVTVVMDNNSCTVKGPLGQLSCAINSSISASQNENIIEVKRINEQKESRELHGLTRTLIYNMIIGVTEGYQKELNLVGVGYNADASQKDFLILNLGYSHPIYFQTPDLIDFETPNPTTVIVKGINKQEVGEVSAKIRNLRKPEPYKGKGVKYSNEHIRRKAGKTVGA